MALGFPELLLILLLVAVPLTLIALLVRFLLRGGQARRVDELEQRVRALERQQK